MRQFVGLPRRAVLEQRCRDASALPRDPSVAGDEARLFRALGDETRVQIVRLLATQEEPLCVCHVEAAFSLSQPTISHHLKVLRDARLVTAERHGVWIYYRLNPERLGALRKFVAAVAHEPGDEKE
ncbi:MAG: ArsR/SmtB family transcription factor [Chloroflexota bacterium]